MLGYGTGDDLQRADKGRVVVAAETEDNPCRFGVVGSPISRQWCDANSLLSAPLDDVLLGPIEYQDSVQAAVDRFQSCPW